MYKDHPSFKIDVAKNLPLWRYMDFWKFLGLVTDKKLFFPNVEMLGDQFEGRIPKKAYDLMLKDDEKKGQKFAEDYKHFIENNLRKRTLVCSWIANKNESFAMWKMYAKEKLGVAIKTDIDLLKKSFNNAKETIYVGEVFYYDDNSPYYESGNTFYTFLVKHDYYQFESEVRCIIELESSEADGSFKLIDVDLKTLIKEVYISPFAEKAGFKDIIEFLRDKNGLGFDVKVSGVNDNWL